MKSKTDFMRIVQEQIFDHPELIDKYGNALYDAYDYFCSIKTPEKENTILTDKGRAILQFMQENEEKCSGVFYAKPISEALNLPTKSVSMALRKLTAEGFVTTDTEQVPATYRLTEVGLTMDLTE